jgi:hypothetical protein
MVHSRREVHIGWVVSVFFHIAVALILFFSTFRKYIPEPQFVKMTWGDINSLQSPVPEIPSERTAAKEEI